MASHRLSPQINLNLNVRGLSQSATLWINETSNQMIRDGKKVFKLGLGQSPFPVPEVVQDELKANTHQKDYLPVMGLRELRGSVADYFHRRQATEYQPSNIMVGPGSKELMFILQLVYYGDLVIPTPSWVSYAPQAHIIGRHISWVPTKPENHWRISPEELEKICFTDPDRPRLVILNYPANPTGGSYTMTDLKEIARIARKYRLVLLSDEIYGELQYDGKHVSISRYYPEGTIVSTGLSKWAGAGGWRLGVFAFPASLNWLRDAMAVVASETFTSTSAPIQYAAIRAFKGGIKIEHYLANSRKILKKLGMNFYHQLKKAGIEAVKPEGAFYLFPDFKNYRQQLLARGIHTSEDLSRTLLDETGVAVLPGSAFGRQSHELTVRAAFVDFDGSNALAAAEQLPPDEQLGDDFPEIYTPNLVEAFNRMVGFVKSL